MSWHLRKDVSVGTIVSLIVLMVGSIAAFATVREQLNHKADDTTVATIAAQQRSLHEDIKEIKENQKEILRELRK